jgi:hypothetical protein
MWAFLMACWQFEETDLDGDGDGRALLHGLVTPWSLRPAQNKK